MDLFLLKFSVFIICPLTLLLISLYICIYINCAFSFFFCRVLLWHAFFLDFFNLFYLKSSFLEGLSALRNGTNCISPLDRLLRFPSKEYTVLESSIWSSSLVLDSNHLQWTPAYLCFFFFFLGNHLIPVTGKTS